MKTINYLLFQKKLRSCLNIVRNKHEPLVVDCGADEDIVIISKVKYDNMEDFFLRFKKSVDKN